jgi:peptidyl-prolyl cis-trans isomerase SurA
MHRRLEALALFALVTSAPLSAMAGPLVVDRIVAVVDTSPILLSELRERARPYKLQVRKTNPPEDKRAEAEAQVDKQVLERIVEERLIAIEAKRRRISVAEDEIGVALKNVAASRNVTVETVLAEAREAALTETDYRDEIRRQLLDGKVLVAARREHPPAAPKEGAPHHEPTPEELTAGFEKSHTELLASLREHTFVEVRP